MTISGSDIRSAKLRMMTRLLLLCRLNRSQRDGVDDIVNQCATRQVVNWLTHALQHWPDRNQVSRTLYGFVSGVTGVQVWEDEHGRFTRNWRVRRFRLSHVSHDSRIILQRTIDDQVRTFFLSQTRCFADFLNVATCTSCLLYTSDAADE